MSIFSHLYWLLKVASLMPSGSLSSRMESIQPIPITSLSINPSNGRLACTQGDGTLQIGLVQDIQQSASECFHRASEVTEAQDEGKDIAEGGEDPAFSRCGVWLTFWSYHTY